LTHQWPFRLLRPREYGGVKVQLGSFRIARKRRGATQYVMNTRDEDLRDQSRWTLPAKRQAHVTACFFMAT